MISSVSSMTVLAQQGAMISPRSHSYRVAGPGSFSNSVQQYLLNGHWFKFQRAPSGQTLDGDSIKQMSKGWSFSASCCPSLFLLCMDVPHCPFPSSEDAGGERP